MSKYKLCTLIRQRHFPPSQYWSMLVPASPRRLFQSGLVHCTALERGGHFGKATMPSECFLHSHIFVFFVLFLFFLQWMPSVFSTCFTFFPRFNYKTKKIWKKCTQEHLSNALKSFPSRENAVELRPLRKNEKRQNEEKTRNILIINNYNFTIFWIDTFIFTIS